MRHSNRFCQCMSHVYVICTVLGMLFLFLNFRIAILFLSIGASSIYVSMGIFAAAQVSRFWGIGAFTWSVIFPVFLIFAYIFSRKKKYYPILVAFLLDIAVVLFAAVHLFMTENMYGFGVAIVDLFVSLLIALLFWRNIRIHNEK